MIRTEGLSVRLGSALVVDGLDFTVAAGESLALWGENGAGKTTVIRALLGLVPFSGQVRLAGREMPREGRAARAAVGYVPQQLAYYEDMSSLGLLQFLAALRVAPRGMPESLLERVGLADHAAERKTDDMRPVDAERVEEAGKVVRKIVSRRRCVAYLGQSMPAGVVAQAAVASGESCDLGIPQIEARPDRMGEDDHRRPRGTGELVVMREAVRDDVRHAQSLFPPKARSTTAAAAATDSAMSKAWSSAG